MTKKTQSTETPVVRLAKLQNVLTATGDKTEEARYPTIKPNCCADILGGRS